MTISQLINVLEELKERHGDLPVRWENIEHLWPPDPVVRTRSGQEIVILNS